MNAKKLAVDTEPEHHTECRVADTVKVCSASIPLNFFFFWLSSYAYSYQFSAVNEMVLTSYMSDFQEN